VTQKALATSIFRLTRQPFCLCQSRIEARWKDQDDSYTNAWMIESFGVISVTFPERFTFRFGCFGLDHGIGHFRPPKTITARVHRG
jgi:hypothetical protein